MIIDNIQLVTPRQNCCTHRYAGVGLRVDGSPKAAARTPNPYNPGFTPFDMLQFKTGEPLTGRKFKLDWTIPNKDQYAQIQFLDIQFTRSEGHKDDNDGCVSAYVK